MRIRLRPKSWTPEDPEVADIAHWGALDPPEYATDPVVVERIRENQARLKPGDKSQEEFWPGAERAAERIDAKLTPRGKRDDRERLREVLPLASADEIERLGLVEVAEVELADENYAPLLSALAAEGMHVTRLRSCAGLLAIAEAVAPGGVSVELRITGPMADYPPLVEALFEELPVAAGERRDDIWELLVEMGQFDMVGTAREQVLGAAVDDVELVGLFRVTAPGLRTERMTAEGWVEDPALLPEIARFGRPVGPAEIADLARRIAQS